MKEIIFGSKKMPAIIVIGDGRFSALKIMEKIMPGSNVKIFEQDSAGKDKLWENLPQKSFIIFNYDDESEKELKNKIFGNILPSNVLSFGFGEGADFRVSDINVDEKGTNFKIINEGKTIPFWIDGLFGREQIYGALAAVCAGKIIGKNLVEISQSLKSG